MTVTAVAEDLQGVKNSVLIGQNVRQTVICCECNKPRCIFAKKTLTLRESRTLHRLMEKYDYSCGALLIPEGDALHGSVFVRLQLCCQTPVEFAYYASVQHNTRKDICCFCGGEGAQKDENLTKKFKIVLPMCAICKASGKEPLKRNPIKQL